MRTIVLAAPKGGVGKTTLTLSLACHVATLRQQQVALLDFDHSQGSLASWWRRRGSPDLAGDTSGAHDNDAVADADDLGQVG